MMEVAKNVREFLVGLKETLSTEEESLLSSLQDLHEQYLTIMEDFTKEISALGLAVRPEAREVAYELRLKIYRNWRARLTERIFAGSPPSLAMSLKSMSLSPASSPTGEHETIIHLDNCEEELCVCALRTRLETYKTVIAEYLVASTKIKHTGSNESSPVTVGKQLEDDSPDLDDGDEDENKHLFKLPEFLRLDRLQG